MKIYRERESEVLEDKRQVDPTNHNGAWNNIDVELFCQITVGGEVFFILGAEGN